MSSIHDELSRREAIALGIAGAAAIAAPAACSPASTTATKGEGEAARTSTAGRLPVAYVPHGGGPWPFVDVGLSREEYDGLTEYLRGVAALPKEAPRALLVVSAHWEEAVPTVMSGATPPLYFDYYGFPRESYELTWPAPGDPRLAARVRELLHQAGFETGEDAARGFDHGTFVPFKVTYPDARVPTVQLSLKKGLDPATHLAMGRALAPLRDEGIFILGSGMSFHNLRAFRHAQGDEWAEAFDGWLREAAMAEPDERDRRLTGWASAPAARLAHPREEHLLPLMVVAGAAGADRGRMTYNGKVFGKRISGYHFG